MDFEPGANTEPFGTLMPLTTEPSSRFASPMSTCLSPCSRAASLFWGTATPNSKLTPSPLNSCDGSLALAGSGCGSLTPTTK